jgi:peroxiredoxin
MFLAGVAVPDVDLPSTGGGLVNPSRLRGTAVIYCYPWTGRPGVADPPDWDSIPGAHGSTPQSLSYAKSYAEFLALDVRVLGLSLQETGWQEEFAARCRLPFDLLSDREGRFSNALGLPRFSTGGESYLERLTLTVAGGLIVHCRHPVPNPETDALEMAEILRRKRAQTISAPA